MPDPFPTPARDPRTVGMMAPYSPAPGVFLPPGSPLGYLGQQLGPYLDWPLPAGEPVPPHLRNLPLTRREQAEKRRAEAATQAKQRGVARKKAAADAAAAKEVLSQVYRGQNENIMPQPLVPSGQMGPFGAPIMGLSPAPTVMPEMFRDAPYMPPRTGPAAPYTPARDPRTVGALGPSGATGQPGYMNYGGISSPPMMAPYSPAPGVFKPMPGQNRRPARATSPSRKRPAAPYTPARDPRTVGTPGPSGATGPYSPPATATPTQTTNW